MLRRESVAASGEDGEQRTFTFPLLMPSVAEPPFLEYVPRAARLGVLRRYEQQEEYYPEDPSDDEGEQGGSDQVNTPPLEWYVKELQKEVNQVAITMSDRVRTVNKRYVSDPGIFRSEGPWGVLLETVRHFTSAAFHANSMACHLAREAGRAPVAPVEPQNPDEAFAQLHTAISKLQLGTNRLAVALRRFKNNPEEIENYVDTVKLFCLLPMVEFAVERSAALVNAMDRVKMVGTTITVSLAAMRMKRKAQSRIAAKATGGIKEEEGAGQSSGTAGAKSAGLEKRGSSALLGAVGGASKA